MGPLFYYNSVSTTANVVFIVGTWPFALVNVLLISFFWQEIMLFAMERKGFLQKLKIPWIISCIFIFVVEMIISILFILSPTVDLFDLYLKILISSQIGMNIIVVIYNAVVAIVLIQHLNQNKNNVRNDQKLNIKIGVSVSVINFGLVVFIVGLFMIEYGLNYNFYLRVPSWAILYMGQVISDYGISALFLNVGSTQIQRSSHVQSPTTR